MGHSAPTEFKWHEYLCFDIILFYLSEIALKDKEVLFFSSIR